MSTRRTSRHCPFYRRTPVAAALLCAGLLGVAPAFAATITVNSNLDTSGNVAICTLRDAITSAKTNFATGGCGAGTAGADTINFNIPGAGVHTIVLSSTLPSITETVTIDGYSQPGATANTIAYAYPAGAAIDAQIMVEIDGNGLTVGSGLFLVNSAANNSSFSGLSVGNYLGAAAFYLQGSAKITGNFIGVRADGTTAFPNNQEILVWPGAQNTVIGSTGAAANRNLLARSVSIAGATNVTVSGNLIGTTKSGAAAVGGILGSGGISVTSSGPTNVSNNIIGVGNEIGLQLTGANNTSVHSNLIGVGVGGVALPNLDGIRIDNNNGDSTNNVITGNTIANHSTHGIMVWDAVGTPTQLRGNDLSLNSIYSSDGPLGIDLRPFNDGLSLTTPNDANDTDAGPNGLQNYPVITTAKANAGGGIDIAFTLNSTPNTEFAVTGYANPTCNSSGHGDGRYPSAAANTLVNTDSTGNISGTITVPAPLPVGWSVGQVVTLLARNTPTGDTSEFSGCATVAAFGVVNQPPAAVGDTYTTPFNTALSVAATGVLTNDSDPDGNPITAILSTGPSHGSLTLNANGSFVYTPTAGYSGADSFSYFANDGTVNSTSAATVGITVGAAAANHAPVAANDTYTTPLNTALTVVAAGVLTNDSDPDGNPITANVVSIPSHGTLSFFHANGNFSYTPTAGYSGADSFTYSVTDGALTSAAATVNISVGPAPAGAITNVPTLSEWALALLSLMLAGFTALVSRKKS